MTRLARTAAVAAALVLSVVVLAGTTAGASVQRWSAARHHKAKPVTFTGTITCALSATMTAKPPVMLVTPQETTLTLKGTLSKCTGTTKKGKVSIKGGTISSTSKGSVSCGTIASTSSVPGATGTVSWRAKGGTVKATTFSFSGGSASVASGTITYPGTGDTAKSTGSFTGKTASLTGVLTESASEIGTQCASGLSTLRLGKGSSFKA